MARTSRKTGKLERIFSILILILLGAVAGSVYVKQNYYDRDKFRFSEAVLDSHGQVGGQVADLKAFLPQGYKPMTAAEIYGPENLYEKINGKAPLYLDSGFEQLAAQRFVSESDGQSWFEVYLYDMGAVKNAFAVYSSQKRSNAEGLDFHENAYKTQDSVFAAAGKYYTEIVGGGTGEEISGARIETARKIAAEYAGGEQGREGTSVLSRENLIAGSEELKLSGAFGFSGFSNTYLGRYEVSGSKVTGFVSVQESPESAKAMAEDYIDFLKQNEGKVLENVALDSPGAAMDFWGLYEIVFYNGKYVGGVHEAENLDVALEVMKIIDQHLTDIQ